MFGLPIIGALGVLTFITLLAAFLVSVVLSGIKEIGVVVVREYWTGKLQLFMAVSGKAQEGEEIEV